MTATIFWQLLLGFGAISLVSVGGGIAVLPEMHRMVVDVHGWMSDADFARRFALAQAAPGPNVLVVGLFGWHVGGILGMLTASAAMTVPTSLIAFGFSRLAGDRQHEATRAQLDEPVVHHIKSIVTFEKRPRSGPRVAVVAGEGDHRRPAAVQSADMPVEHHGQAPVAEAQK